MMYILSLLWQSKIMFIKKNFNSIIDNVLSFRTYLSLQQDTDTCIFDVLQFSLISYW